MARFYSEIACGFWQSYESPHVIVHREESPFGCGKGRGDAHKEVQASQNRAVQDLAVNHDNVRVLVSAARPSSIDDVMLVVMS